MAASANDEIVRQKPNEIRSALDPGSLYILLYWQRDPAVRFHWGLWHHASSSTGGWKFDIIRPGGVWAPSVSHDGPPRADVIDPDPTEPLACAVRIATLGTGNVEAHDLIRAEDDRLNELDAKLNGTLSCRVYVHRACERLQHANVIQLFKWQDMEEEVLAAGNRNEKHRGEGPTIIDSKVTRSGDCS